MFNKAAHSKEKRDGPKKKVPCGHCGKSFKSKAGLQNHKRIKHPDGHQQKKIQLNQGRMISHQADGSIHRDRPEKAA
jgi:hypothetical protein